VDKRRKNGKLVDRKCTDFSVIIPLSVCREDEEETRRGPSTFENMPFLLAEDALLDTRRVSSLMLFVTF
jgi:hypothetical protein